MTERNAASEGRRERGIEIVVLPDGAVLGGPSGTNLLRFLRERGLEVDALCGGQGTCGQCRVRFVDAAPAPTPADRSLIDGALLAEGWRLACAHEALDSIRIEVAGTPGDLDQKASDDDALDAAVRDPMVRAHSVRVGNGPEADRRTLADRVSAALPALRLGQEVLRCLPSAVTGSADHVSVIATDTEILDVRSVDVSPICGAAIDVGTTTMAVHILDLATGRQIGSAAGRNPQRLFGADVISRIAHVRRETRGLAELHEAVMDGLNALLLQAGKRAGVCPGNAVYSAIVVGNPTMLHLFLGVDPRGIDVTPYTPVFSGTTSGHARDVGLGVHPRAVVETLPAVSAYVGADIVAGAVAVGLEHREGTTLFLDVGTNGEVVLARDGRLVACSTAAGPAFEGASIASGMPALPGAIESLSIGEAGIRCSVIGNGVARGLCGSGLVSAVAELRRAGVVDASGRFAEARHGLQDRLSGDGAQRRFRLADGEHAVYIYQADVREFQLAKAALRAGVEILLRHVGLDAEEIDRVLVGGAFSHGLRPESLVDTGLLPPIDPGKVELVGNTAAKGARRALMSREVMAETVRLARRIEYVELSGHGAFAEVFVESMALGEPERRGP